MTIIGKIKINVNVHTCSVEGTVGIEIHLQRL